MQKSAKSQVYDPNWTAYYNAVVGRPPRHTLLAALTNFEAENASNTPCLAVDLGCGEGRDTVEMLSRGWRVLAIDAQKEAINRLLSRPDINTKLLEISLNHFEEVVLPPAVDLINASFALPFCHPEYFPSLWSNIVASLRSGGRFSGQLFGNKDTWAIYSSMNHHSRAEVEILLQPFVIEMLEEEDHLGKTAIGEEKHWHIFHIVARKK